MEPVREMKIIRRRRALPDLKLGAGSELWGVKRVAPGRTGGEEAVRVRELWDLVEAICAFTAWVPAAPAGLEAGLAPGEPGTWGLLHRLPASGGARVVKGGADG